MFKTHLEEGAGVGVLAGAFLEPGGGGNIEGVIQEQNIDDEQPDIEVLDAAGAGNIGDEPPDIEVLAAAGGGNIDDEPVLQEQIIVDEPVLQEQIIVDEPPVIEELAGAGGGNNEVPLGGNNEVPLGGVITTEPLVNTEEETPLVDSVVTQETPPVTKQAKERPTIAKLAVGQDFFGIETSNTGDIGSFEDSDNETPSVEYVSTLEGKIAEVRVKFEAAKKELSSIVLSDSFWLSALEDVILEKLPLKYEPLEINLLKDLLVEKFKIKWHFNHMLDFEHIFEKMVGRGLGSEFVVLERSEGKAYLKLVGKEIQALEFFGVYETMDKWGSKLQQITQELEKLDK